MDSQRHRLIRDLVNELRFSMATFRKGTFEKFSYVFLELLDLDLTCLAFALGLKELNPILVAASGSPFVLVLLKVAIPVFFAWLVPRKLLWPSIAFMTFIVLWDLKEMVLFVF